MTSVTEYIRWLDQLGMDDLEQVGGKNASLGEMIANLASMGVNVPGGFATTADAFRDFLAETRLDEKIRARLESLDVEDVRELAAAGKEIRAWIVETALPEALSDAIRDAWTKMLERFGDDIEVAVRSSATAEDLPDASFAGQQETFLNVRGLEDVARKIHEVFASLYNDRAIAYRVHHLKLRAGRKCCPGRGESRRVLSFQGQPESRPALGAAPQHRHQGYAHGV